jgi:predicted Zn finger-like uncharacterized protein
LRTGAPPLKKGGMRIACPSCSAEYDVPDSLLAAGRRALRCTRCGHQFHAGAPPAPPPAVPQRPDAPAPEPVAATPPRPEPPPAAAMELPPAPPAAAPPASPPAPSFQDRVREAATDPAPRTGGALAAAWAISFAVLGACGWAGYRYQADIVEAWPPAARFYQAVGLH